MLKWTKKIQIYNN